MTAPKRWSDLGGGATRDEKALLEAGANETMPNDLRERLWSAIALATVASSAAGTATTEAAGHATLAGGTPVAPTSKGLALLSSSLAKGVVAVAVLGGIGTGGVLLHAGPSARSVVTSSSATRPTRQVGSARATVTNVPSPESSARGTAPPSSALGASPAERAASTPSAAIGARREKLRSHAGLTSPDASGTSPAGATPDSPVSRLREESLAVLAIRRSLLAGQPNAALQLLDRAQRDFPGGALMEEREALTVRALLGAGRQAAARQHGAAFLKAFPRSVHAAEVRGLLGD